MKALLNPVFRREARTALRTWKIFTAMMCYVLMLTLVTALALLVVWGEQVHNGFNPQNATMLYVVIAAFQLGLILLITPALTGGAISSERERQTLDLMLVTKMSTLSIIIGKLTSSLLVVALLIFASLPVYGVIMYYGGINLLHLFAMALYFLLVAAMTGAIAIFFSALFKRTIAAIILTYIVLLVFSLGTMIALLIMAGLLDVYFNIGVPYTLAYGIIGFNPFWGFIAVLDSQLGSSITTDFLDGMSRRFWMSPTPLPPPSLPPLWVANGLFNTWVVVGFVAWASVLIKPGRKSSRKR